MLAQLEEGVATRRASGDYPVGIEEQLSSRFQEHLKSAASPISTDELHRRIGVVELSTARLSSSVELGSRFPGGAAAHAAAARVVTRHTSPLADSVRDVAVSVSEALLEVRSLLELDRNLAQRRWENLHNATMDRLAILDHLAVAVLDLEQRIFALESPKHQP